MLIPSPLYELCVWGPWQKPVKTETPELQLSRISEGKKGTERCLCYHWFLSINKVNYIGLVSKALVNHQRLLPRSDWSSQVQLKCFCQHINPKHEFLKHLCNSLPLLGHLNTYELKQHIFLPLNIPKTTRL